MAFLKCKFFGSPTHIDHKVIFIFEVLEHAEDIVLFVIVLAVLFCLFCLFYIPRKTNTIGFILMLWLGYDRRRADCVDIQIPWQPQLCSTY